MLDVLESQFPYSRVCLHEMLELHEGNLEVALDMLAQLEAEMDGQLPASGQVSLIGWATPPLGTRTE